MIVYGVPGVTVPDPAKYPPAPPPPDGLPRPAEPPPPNNKYDGLGFAEIVNGTFLLFIVNPPVPADAGV